MNGTVTLPAGLRLYHVSTTCIHNLPEKPLISMTLHPSELYIGDTFVSVIELNRDVTLSWMIQCIYNQRIVPVLQKDAYEGDGYMCSIRNTVIQCVILNDPTILKFVECGPIRIDWRNIRLANDLSIVPKEWGTYSIYTQTHPVQLHLHERFRNQLEAYTKTMEVEDPLGTGFCVMLENALISYTS